MSDGPENRPGSVGGPDSAGQGPNSGARPGHESDRSNEGSGPGRQLPQWGMVTVAGQGRPAAEPQAPAPALGNEWPPAQPATQPQQLPADGGRESNGRRGVLLPLLAGLGLLILGAAGYAAFTQLSGDEEADAQLEVGSTAVSDPVEEIQRLLQGIGYEDVEVTQSDGTIYVSGDLESQSDVAAVVTASASLADGVPINVDGLRTGSADQPESDDGTTDADGSGESGDAGQPVVVAASEADPLQRLQVALHRTVAASPIIFAPGTSTTAEWHEGTLDQVADLLLANPGIAVIVVGYTDDTGPAEGNQTLSLERADAVRDYLIAKGVAPGLIEIEARGESESSGLRDIGYLERRVEFEVVAASADPPPVLPLNVGIIVPSPRDDLAFSQSLVDALAVLEEERGGLTVTITDNMFDPDEGREQARQYVADGANVVILHGAEFLPIIEELALEFPDVVFVSGPDGYETSLPNVFVYVVYAEQGAYVMGDLAASLSGSDTLGIVGPIQVPEPQRYVEGFRAGAEARGSEVLVDYVGSFFDVEAASTMAEGFIDNGADVLTGTAELVVGPIDVVADRDLLWFANQTNPSQLAPQNIVAAQVYHFEVAIREILAEIDANSTSGGTFPMTLGNGGMLIEFNPEFDLDPALRRRADDLLFQITAGSLDVEVDVEE